MWICVEVFPDNAASFAAIKLVVLKTLISPIRRWGCFIRIDRFSFDAMCLKIVISCRSTLCHLDMGVRYPWLPCLLRWVVLKLGCWLKVLLC